MSDPRSYSDAIASARAEYEQSIEDGEDPDRVYEGIDMQLKSEFPDED